MKIATREENLQKINEELEKLDDEQLEQIAGGRTGIYEQILEKSYIILSDEKKLKAVMELLKDKKKLNALFNDKKKLNELFS